MQTYCLFSSLEGSWKMIGHHAFLITCDKTLRLLLYNLNNLLVNNNKKVS